MKTPIEPPYYPYNPIDIPKVPDVNRLTEILKMALTIRIFIDMDDTLCDFTYAYIEMKQRHPEIEFPQSQRGFFRELRPIADAIETLQWLKTIRHVDTHILTAPSVKNPLCYTEKRLWVEEHLGIDWVDNLHISPRKDFFIGDLLIDDQHNGRGQEAFSGIAIPFGYKSFSHWERLRSFLERVLTDDFQLSQSELIDLTICETNTAEKLAQFQFEKHRYD